jgi:hypothetical protein
VGDMGHTSHGDFHIPLPYDIFLENSRRSSLSNKSFGGIGVS